MSSSPAGGEVKLSVVVPLYRNATTLEELVRRLEAAMEGSGHRWELLLVDDASPDDTLAAVREACRPENRPAGCAGVGGLALRANQGQQRAVLVGLAQARGEWAVVLDGDLQDPPEAIPRLLIEAERPRRDAAAAPEAVFAARRGRYQSQGRRLTSRLFKGLLARLTGVPADAGLFVLSSRRMRDALWAFDDRRPFVVAMLGLTGLPLGSVPVERAARQQGESAYTGGMRLRVGLSALAFALSWRFLHRGRGRPPVADELVAERFGEPFDEPPEEPAARRAP